MTINKRLYRLEHFNEDAVVIYRKGKHVGYVNKAGTLFKGVHDYCVPKYIVKKCKYMLSDDYVKEEWEK